MPAESCCIMTSPVGRLLLHASHERLTGLIILADTDERAGAAAVAAMTAVDRGHPVLHQAVEQLEQYFAGHRQLFRLPLELTNLPAFTHQILATLQSVPFGETLTYGALAARAGYPRAARAVGQVMAANPLPIIIPCHRVVAAGGRPGGYSGGGGVSTKEWLLAFERANHLAT